MATGKPRQISQATMLGQIEQVLKRGRPGDPPAYTLILGAGASFGSIPTAKQMLGISNQGIIHPQCIPAWLFRRENDAEELSAAQLTSCVKEYWDRFSAENPALIRTDTNSQENLSRISIKNGAPDTDSVAHAYTAVFDQGIGGGINTAAEARTYLRDITLPSRKHVELNGTHFFLASLLSLQRRIGERSADGSKPLYVGKRPFARTVFTTNFDPLLQISLQLFQLLYYMTDRPDLLPADALQTDDHPAIHLFYAHGSVHRPFLANTQDEIEFLSRNTRELAAYLGLHGVIVLGYSGWDDCLLRALNQTSSFSHNLYWLARGESSLSPNVHAFLSQHPSAYWVPISDGGEFMADLHTRLCPGMRNTELLSNPIRPLREQLERVVLTAITADQTAAFDGDTAIEDTIAAARPTSPEEFRQQILRLLKDAEIRLTTEETILEPEESLRRAEYQADLAYSNADWAAALTLYKRIGEDPACTSALRAKAYFRLAFSNSQIYKPEAAILEYTKVIEMSDSPVEHIIKALFNRGVCYSRQDEPNRAIADYTKVIEFPSASVEQKGDALFDRGFCYRRQDQADKAIDDYTAIIEMLGVSVEQKAIAFFNRGFCQAQQNQLDKAIDDYTNIVDLPNAPAKQTVDALFNRGFCHGQQNQLDKAIEDYTRVIELSNVPIEQKADALFNRGVCRSRQNQLDKAIEDYTKVIELPGASVGQKAQAVSSRGVVYTQKANALAP